MAISRYSHRNPWRELDQLTGRLSQMFEEGSGYPMPSSAGAWMPAVSVEETDGELILTAELPGVNPDHVDVQLENNILTVRGEKNEERREEDENRRYHVWERTYGSFQRSFTLPRTVRADEITAEFKDGLLRVRMPKAPEARSRRIEVARGTAANELEGRTRNAVRDGSKEQSAVGRESMKGTEK
jgi:HSP20 family protein